MGSGWNWLSMPSFLLCYVSVHGDKSLTINQFYKVIRNVKLYKNAEDQRPLIKHSAWRFGWRSQPTRCPKCCPGSESLRRIPGKKKASCGLNTHSFHLIWLQYCWHLHVPPSWRAGCWASPCPKRSLRSWRGSWEFLTKTMSPPPTGSGWSSKKSVLVCRLAMPRNLKKIIYLCPF